MKLRVALLACLFCTALGQGQAAAQSVGVSAAVNPSTLGAPPGQQIRTITLGDQIIHNERIETDADGLLQVLLADGTTFTVGPSSSLVIDSFVYDPAAGTASVAATLGRGVFRFIGSQTSKGPGAVTLNTPVGTVGIRGAIADMDFGHGERGWSYIVLRYGAEITLDRGGRRLARLYRPGYVIVVDEEGRPEVRRAPPGWTAMFQRSISGAQGAGGGAPTAPTGNMVQESGIPNVNSDMGPEANATPLPTPAPPIESRDIIDDVNRDDRRRDAIDAEPDYGSGHSEIPLRVLTAQDSSGEGIVGGTSDTDQTITLAVEAGQGEGELAQGPVTLPVYDDDAFTTRTVSGSSPFGNLSGTAYSGPGGFTAYLLGIDGDQTRPFYAIAGAPSNGAAAFQGGAVRLYSLTADPIQGVGGIPFVTGGLDFTGAISSPFMIAETDNVAAGGAKVFQSWLSISGTGAGQRSGIGVNVGELNSTGTGFNLERRGSYRMTADDQSYSRFGTAAALSGGEGGAIFGPNGENFVVGAGLDPSDRFYDSPAFPDMPSGAEFSTIHVGNLEGTMTPSRTLSGTYRGFAAGALEGVPDSLPVTTVSDHPDSVTVAFNPATRTLGGAITLGDMFSSLTVAFGDGVGGNTQDGASAYIDDDIFGAAANPNPSATHSSSMYSDPEYQQRTGQDAATYFVSSGSVEGLWETEPMESVAPAYRCSDCDFLKWGWWGTQAQLADPTADPSEELFRQSVHMGTWVAGEIASMTELDDLSSLSASYQGLAVGTVVSGADTYIAAGRMDMDFNFGSREGSMAITDFDGRDFSGAVDSFGGFSDARFSGSLSGSDSSMWGWTDGAFVNDPNATGNDAIAAGVIGNFTLQDSDWSAAGILAGSR